MDFYMSGRKYREVSNGHRENGGRPFAQILRGSCFGGAKICYEWYNERKGIPGHHLSLHHTHTLSLSLCTSMWMCLVCVHSLSLTYTDTHTLHKHVNMCLVCVCIIWFIQCNCKKSVLHAASQTLLSNLSKEVGSPVKIGNFFRMEVGEGIQRYRMLFTWKKT